MPATQRMSLSMTGPAKASYDVKVGDIIAITFGEKTLKVEVTDVKETVGKIDFCRNRFIRFWNNRRTHRIACTDSISSCFI